MIFYETPLFFDVEEKKSLIHTADFAEEAGYYDGKSLNSAIRKLRNHSNLDQKNEKEKHMSSLEVIMRNNTYTLRSHLEILEYCVTDRNSVIILYRKGGDDVSQDTQFVPYRIIYWKNKWYLVAYCHLRDDV